MTGANTSIRDSSEGIALRRLSYSWPPFAAQSRETSEFTEWALRGSIFCPASFGGAVAFAATGVYLWSIWSSVGVMAIVTLVMAAISFCIGVLSLGDYQIVRYNHKHDTVEVAWRRFGSVHEITAKRDRVQFLKHAVFLSRRNWPDWRGYAIVLWVPSGDHFTLACHKKSDDIDQFAHTLPPKLCDKLDKLSCSIYASM